MMTWEVDSEHSEVSFALRHFVTQVRGRFNIIRGSLHIDEQNPAESWVEAEADTKSIDTGNEGRDQHLRSPDFFDATAHPVLRFKSTRVEQLRDNDYTVTGDLSIRGVTRPVVFHTSYLGQVKDLRGQQRAGVSTTAQINRKDWGITWNQALDSGGSILSDEVKIEMNLEMVHKG